MAILAVNDAGDRREPDAGAREVGLAVEPLEHAEQIARVRLVEPGPVVPHEVRRRVIDGRGS
ncbi:MAG TPA: hypothetical protein VK427_08055, partial [Kofleriaceae bacterium]|nr:hypothetical protein [Kofleriaceae bacterium]